MSVLPSTPPPGTTSSILQRYCDVIPVQRGPGEWNQQNAYGEAFVNMKRRLSDADLRAMLEHGPWLACPARRDGMTDRIGFDLDCREEADHRQRDALYWSIRNLFGLQHVPLVYRTPSGHGLRVYYAIPITPLSCLVTGRRTGLVADVLRAAGLPVTSGVVEIFPQATQVDRLPLGRRMPLLNPESLEPIPEAAIGDAYDADLLMGALIAVERWAAAPCMALVSHLESLPRAASPLVLSDARDDGEKKGFVGAINGLEPSQALRRLVRHGLVRPSSRYESEWLVGIAMLLKPELFDDLGLTDSSDDAEVAITLARWVEARENGFSEEWAQHRRRIPHRQAAVRSWANRYLARGAVTELHTVDRLRRAVAALDGSLHRTFLISERERLQLMGLVDAANLSCSKRFRAEVWLASYQRAVKFIIAYRREHGILADEQIRDGQATVVIPIAARWMERWQFGKGRYSEYRRLLFKAGWLRLTAFSPMATAFLRQGRAPLTTAFLKNGRPPHDLAFDASEYEIRVPEMDLLVRDVGVDPRTLRRALDQLRPTMNGRAITLDTAHHVLWLCQSGLPLRQRYGSRLGRNIEAIGSALLSVMAPQTSRITHARKYEVVQCTGDRRAEAA